MKGHVPTPQALAQRIVEKLFADREPEEGDRILYPGLGTGPFGTAVRGYCEDRDLPVPRGVGVENDPRLVTEARERHAGSGMEILDRDFLADLSDLGQFRYIVGNPPYVPIEGLSAEEKQRYKSSFKTAQGRFDLYILFYEQALRLLAPSGRLCFITPEKFEYTLTAEPLRTLLASNYHVTEIHHIEEDAFEGLTTYPTITTVDNAPPGPTRVLDRDGSEREVELPRGGESWARAVRGGSSLDAEGARTLEDVCVRVSCGLATGADKVFVQPRDKPTPEVRSSSYPTISGRQLSMRDGPKTTDVIICPYEADGSLVAEDELGEVGEWLGFHDAKLKSRSCVQSGGKPWYAWHENPPLDDVLRPKILCPDLTNNPRFWPDREGRVLPRHSVYYIVPERDEWLDPLLEHLNGPEARAWIEAHAQRAANGSLRLQSTVLKQLPVPERVLAPAQA